jgi:hypothetical protein
VAALAVGSCVSGQKKKLEIVRRSSVQPPVPDACGKVVI